MVSANNADDLKTRVSERLAASGLVSFGWLNVEDVRSALLIGNVGSSLWPAFSSSSEFADGEPDPMNRWTVSQLQPLVDEMGAEARYPFGDVVWPFQHYAKVATGIEQSPIGLLIHPEFGLWTAFRALLVFDGALDFDVPAPRAHPCESCDDKLCLSTCPIGAFSPRGYAYKTCKTHVRSKEGNACSTGGCLARRACPVGTKHAYQPDHQAFHMNTFV